MANLAEFDRSLVEFFNYSSEATQLFLSLSFLMQRNMMGGLTTYELMAVSNIKHNLIRCFDSYDDKDSINNLVEMISSADYKDFEAVVDSDSVRYIALQDNRSLCKILATYLPDDIGMLVKIPITDNLDYDDLLEQAKAQHPKIILGLDVVPVNPWAVIFSPPSLKEAGNHIVISFPINHKEQRSFYYFKSLNMAKAILQRQEEEHDDEIEEEVKPSAVINSIRFLKGILSLSGRGRKGVDSKLTSRPFIARAVNEDEDSAIEGEVYALDENQERIITEGGEGLTVLEDENTINGGFFDVNHGLHFSVRKPIN